MPAITRFQAGFKDESTWNTPVTVDRFAEYAPGTNMHERHGRVIVPGIRSGQRVRRKDRQVTYKAGADGTLVLPVLSKGFGFWLKHMLGAVATTGPTDSKSTHTGTIGDLLGDSFTLQLNKPFHPADTDQAVTYSGCKISKWKAACKVNDPLLFTLDVDAADYSTATALASAAYPTAGEGLVFVGGAVTVGGSSVDVTAFDVECDNKLLVDRRFIRSSALKKEQVEGDPREIKWSLDCDWESLTQFNRFAAAAGTGLEAVQIVLTFTGYILIGSSSLPTLTITIDEASFDELMTDDLDKPLTQKLSGAGLFDGSASAITVAYGTADATP